MKRQTVFSSLIVHVSALLKIMCDGFKFISRQRGYVKPFPKITLWVIHVCTICSLQRLLCTCPRYVLLAETRLPTDLSYVLFCEVLTEEDEWNPASDQTIKECCNHGSIRCIVRPWVCSLYQMLTRIDLVISRWYTCEVEISWVHVHMIISDDSKSAVLYPNVP